MVNSFKVPWKRCRFNENTKSVWRFRVNIKILIGRLHLVTEKFDIVLLSFRAIFKKDITQCFIFLQQNLYEKILKHLTFHEILTRCLIGITFSTEEARNKFAKDERNTQEIVNIQFSFLMESLIDTRKKYS